MTKITTCCGDCIFCEEDYDSESAGYDTYVSCTILRNIRDMNYEIVAYDSWKDEEVKELKTTLPNCPLKNGAITVELKS